MDSDLDSLSSPTGLGIPLWDVVDASVLESLKANLPKFQTIVGLWSHGASAWATTYRLEVALEDGSRETCFLKTSTGFHGRESLKGEYESTSAIYAIVPEFIPKPIVWGTCTSRPDTHFYIAKFHNLSEDLPEPKNFCKKLAQLHKNGPSPNGKYGFPFVTYNGNLPQENGFTETWEEFFTIGLRHMINLNFAAGGLWTELDDLMPHLFDKVIPRLLRPLETGGNHIQPLLVHGDLWCGNASSDMDTDAPLVFDPCCFYAHNEYELGNWRHKRNKFSQRYFNEYLSHFSASFPAEDYDDRNNLYGIRFNLHAAAMFPHIPSFREWVIKDIKILVEKFPGGYDDFVTQKTRVVAAATEEKMVAEYFQLLL